ncbi:MAG: hypothetical protein IKD86_02840, partial [Firmicutes bacterium]|nr:hypothetical protein [Bacillota bacterium]
MRKSAKQSYFRKRGIQIQDIVLILLFLLLLFFLRRFTLPLPEAFHFESSISYPYIAKQQGELIYVIDESHNRLICFDRGQNERFEVSGLSDNGESALYLDDLAVSGNNIYLSASEWDGMRVARELILRTDPDGHYLETMAERDYSSRFINKHRFYGITAQDGILTYAECLENSILVHRINEETRSEKIESLSCGNAFNAVGDILFDENNIPVVLNKNGRILRFRSDTDPALLYSTEWSGEEERIPFRLGIYDGAFYFTDIRSGSVVRIDTAAQTGQIVYEGTDSQTVTFTPEGRMLLAGADGIRRTGKDETVFLDFRKPDSLCFSQILQILLSCALGAAAILLLIRAAVLLVTHKYTLTQGVSFAVIASVIVVTGIISGMLLHSFRNNYREKIQEQLEAAAYVIAGQISEEDMNGVTRAVDFEGESYRSIVRLMEDSLPVEQDFYSKIYCDILRLDQAREQAFAIAYLD